MSEHEQRRRRRLGWALGVAALLAAAAGLLAGSDGLSWPAFRALFDDGSAALIVGLRRLGLPRVFGTVLTMTQRYLVLVLRQAEELHLARLSRGYGGETVRQGQHWAAAGMGLTLLSSLRLAEAVHGAMTARGYDGDIQTLRPPRWRKRERALVVAGLVLAAALVAWDGWLR